MRQILVTLAISTIAAWSCGGDSAMNTTGGTGGAAGSGTGGVGGTGTGGTAGLGTGGTAGTGTGGTGTGGRGGTAGTGTGGTGGACTLPACVSALGMLQSACQPSGSCTQQIGLGGVNMCYMNGVKVVISVNSATGVSTTRFVKADGTTCWTSEIAATGMSATITYKNASGAVVATVMSGVSGMATVTCPGQAPVPLSCPGGTGGTGGAGGFGGGTPVGMCTMGACM